MSYRGPRSPDAREDAALDRLLAGLEASGPPSGRYLVEAAPATVSALAARLLEAEAGHEEVQLSGVPWCGVPWPNDQLAPAGPPARPAEVCHRCVAWDRCPGPGDLPLRPLTSETPWVPLGRVVRAWTPTIPDGWPALLDALHDAARGPHAACRWSPTLAADVAGGALDPALRLGIFYRREDGVVVPGASLLESLPGVPEDLRRALAPVAAGAALYPSIRSVGAALDLSFYVDMGPMAPAEAWRHTQALAADLDLALEVPALRPALLGVAISLRPATLDLYVPWDPKTPGPWPPPTEATSLAGPGPVVATLRLDAVAGLRVRKWDVPWWSTGRDDAALLDELGAGPTARQVLGRLLASDRFTLFPTTLGLRPHGRRIYLKVA